jgi:AbrB family looped-hinge helix DNA binding protein
MVTPLKKRVKPSPHLVKKYKRIHKGDRLYGTTTIGERGQIVIPAEARKQFGLKPGDQVIALGNKVGKMLTFIKADNIGEFISMVIDHFAGSGLEENFKADFAKMLKKNTPKKLSKK